MQRQAADNGAACGARGCGRAIERCEVVEHALYSALLYSTTLLFCRSPRRRTTAMAAASSSAAQRGAPSSFECGGENEKKKELVARLERGGTFLPCNPNRRSLLWRGARCEATAAAVAVSRCSSRYYIVPVHSSHHPPRSVASVLTHLAVVRVRCAAALLSLT